MVALFFGAITMKFGISSSQAAQQMPFYFTLVTTALILIPSERADRVADRITLELGGVRARLTSRMLTLSISYCGLLLASLAFNEWVQGGIRTPLANALATGVAVILVGVPLATLTSYQLPHPLIAMAFVFIIIQFPEQPRESLVFGPVIERLEAGNPTAWAIALGKFAAIGLLGAVAAWVLARAFGNLKFQRTNLRGQTELKVPGWHAGPRGTLRLALLTARIEVLPMLAIPLALSVYGAMAFALALGYQDLPAGTALYPVVFSLLLTVTLPALLLASGAQRNEVIDQDSLLYRSQSHAFFARALQKALLLTITMAALCLILASMLGVELTDPKVLLSLLVLASLAPVTATAAALLQKWIKLPLFRTFGSYLLTLPQILIAAAWPEAAPWLPSSLIAQLVAGGTMFSPPGSATPPEWLPATVVIATAGLPALLLLRRVRRRLRLG